jgi:FAD/FMN-containing dehydrogenase
MSAASIVTTSLAKLRDEVAGTVIGSDDPGYDEARIVAAGYVDRHPAVIVRVAGAEDVARVIELARETGLELAVRSGGHSGAGHGTTDGGIVIDLRAMKALEIDPPSRAAWAETGLTAIEVTTAVAATTGSESGRGDSPRVASWARGRPRSWTRRRGEGRGLGRRGGS